MEGVSVRDFKVELTTIQEVRPFIERWHYSKSTNGLDSRYCFSLKYDGKLIGAMIFGMIAMAGVWRKYVDKQEDIIELRRLCCIDDTPKNTESYFIGQCLKWIQRNTDFKKVISYADMDFGHTGIIYKATNFKLVGITNKGRVIIHNGKRYHDKSIRTKYKGRLKPFAQRLVDAMESGEAYYEPTKGKYIYIYELKNKKRSR